MGDLALPSLTDAEFAFESSNHDIAGFTIWNNDVDGIGIDNISFGSPGDPAEIPEPGSLPLFGPALIALGWIARRSKQALACA